MNAQTKKIIHIDMDAFYASIEQRDNPQFRGKPLAVGYSGPRGVVAAASYEARKYGVYSAMSSKVALRKCSYLQFVMPRFTVYKGVSNQIMKIFHEYTDLVEPLSLDEAFLDVTENHLNIPYAMTIAEEIKQKIYQQTGLTASAGVSYNKFLAKIASDVNKPNGLFVITPKKAQAFLNTLDISKFYGVGKVTAEKMKSLGIGCGKDLLEIPKEHLIHHFGKAGILYYNFARGIDLRSVEPNRIRKSVGIENTFLTDISAPDDLYNELKQLSDGLRIRLEKAKFYGKTFTLKVRFSNFSIATRSRTFANNIMWNSDDLLNIGADLLSQIDCSEGVRLLGISVKNNDYSSSYAYQLSIDFDLE